MVKASCARRGAHAMTLYREFEPISLNSQQPTSPFLAIKRLRFRVLIFLESSFFQDSSNDAAHVSLTSPIFPVAGLEKARAHGSSCTLEELAVELSCLSYILAMGLRITTWNGEFVVSLQRVRR